MAGGRSSKHRQLRALLKPGWQEVNAPCGICGMATIRYDGAPNEPDSFEMDHILPRVTYPHLEFEPTNLRPSHSRCNRNKNAGDTKASVGITSEAW